MCSIRKQCCETPNDLNARLQMPLAPLNASQTCNRRSKSSFRFHRQVASQSSQLFSTISLTRLLYSRLLSLYKLDASTFAGEEVLGSFRRLAGNVSCRQEGKESRRGATTCLCMLVKMAATSYVGLHRFCKMSKQSSPVL